MHICVFLCMDGIYRSVPGCVEMHTSVYAHVGAKGQFLVSFFLTLFVRLGLSVTWVHWQARLAGQHGPGLHFFLSPSTRNTGVPGHPRFVSGCWGSELRCSCLHSKHFLSHPQSHLWSTETCHCVFLYFKGVLCMSESFVCFLYPRTLWPLSLVATS